MNEPGQNLSPDLTWSTITRSVVVLLIITVLAGFLCTLAGQYDFGDEYSWRVWQWQMWHSTIWQARAYRTIAAGVVGAALAVAGLALQGLLRNPLAEPYVLGISSGAGVGVLLGGAFATATVLPGWAITPAMALIGALITAAAVYLIAQRAGKLDPYVLLLSGVIVNIFNGALILGILQFVKQTEMIHFIGWSMGRIPEWLWFKPALLVFSSTLIIGGWIIVLMRSHALNTLGLGDEVASSSGVRVQRLRIEIFVLVAVMTSASVALAGPIGFIGLIIPHTCRMIIGADHRLLTIYTGFTGATFLIIADTACRLIGQYLKLGELPVGVITALLGGPFFIVVLKTSLRKVSL